MFSPVQATACCRAAPFISYDDIWLTASLRHSLCYGHLLGMLSGGPVHTLYPVPATASKSPILSSRLLPAALAHQHRQPVIVMSAVAPNKADYDERWHRAWKRGVPPGQAWDIGRTAPALINFLDEQSIEIAGRVAFVPGCGRGYDVLELARRGARACGLDLSPESTKEATRYREDTKLSAEQTKNAIFETGDFFTFNSAERPWVDVGYDFTFMCALHPSMRQQWAETWAATIRKGGHLITLQFPFTDSNKAGPPWPVTPQLYSQLLTERGDFQLVYFKEVAELLCSHPGVGGEAIACYQRISRSPAL